MTHFHFEPFPALLEYIDSIYIIDIDFSVELTLSPIYTFVPTHTRFLCFYLHDQVKVKKEEGFVAKAESVIIGPQLNPVTLDLGKRHHTIIVSLKPCGMYRLLGISMDEIVDKDFDARLVMGKEIDELIDRLKEAKTNYQKNQIVQGYLLLKLPRLKPALPFDRAMLHLVHANGNLTVDQVASQSCVSTRQFERVCLERIGLSPKLYARMVRFSYAYKLKEIYPQMPWSQISYMCGYFDQTHFIRDFKQFAKFTPGHLSEEDITSSVRFQALQLSS
ncbi:helix-turn-helix transcriptional regulator [Pedobacter frigoris]|uniref:helix-turn-helix transcriptional regulator n=1 Tax=Pedobacter frigoris TaxID=2571272 RepID=UPI002930E139|nr:helix-turn-helix transcriptional regulator [Pedobacter frigoris]